MKIQSFKRIMKEKHAEKLKGKFLGEEYGKYLITEDCDGIDSYGNLLFRFRKKAIPENILDIGVESFKDSIKQTTSRGNAAGGYYNRIRQDGVVTNFKVADAVSSGNVGFMDAKDGFGTVNYCRKTSFASDHYDKFKQGIPFVKFISDEYKKLCPNHWDLQNKYVQGTNKNYVITDTVYTTVTVNENFRTALHQDSGDLTNAMGNLIVWEDGNYTGGYFMLPEYGIMIDIKSNDLLFVDVHKWHCNTDFKLKEGCTDFTRYSFVMYYREYMYRCESPSQTLIDLKNNSLGYKTL